MTDLGRNGRLSIGRGAFALEMGLGKEERVFEGDAGRGAGGRSSEHGVVGKNASEKRGPENAIRA